MKETNFIKQNKDKWAEAEQELNREDFRPDKISNLYMETVEDLSYARTHYPNRMVRGYLNGVAQMLSLRVQKSQRKFLTNFKRFWAQDFPLVMFDARKELLLSFLMLVFAVGIGVMSSMNDPEFARYILGDAYVNETIHNIESGDPMGIYKDKNQGEMFFSITLNNIMVSARTFLLSLFFGFGTLLALLYNGIMLGVFQYFFIERGLFFESFLTIWQHGVVEISCIVLAGAAGLVLARGVFFPGSYSRLDSFRVAGKKSLVIILGLMVMLVYSGAIEAFVTRYTDIHWIIRLSSILMSVTFVLTYFVWYPTRVHKKHTLNKDIQHIAEPISFSKFSFSGVQTNMTLLWEAVRITSILKPWVITLTIACGAISVLTWYFFGLDYTGYLKEGISYYPLIMQVSSASAIFIFCINFICVFCAILISTKSVNKKIKSDNKNYVFGYNWKKSGFVALLASAAVCGMYSYPILVPVMVFVFPLIGLFTVTFFHPLQPKVSRISQAQQLLNNGYSKLLVIVLFTYFFLFLLTVFTQTFVIQLGSQFLSGFLFQIENSVTLDVLVTAFLQGAFLFLSHFILFNAFHLSYFSLNEIKTGEQLYQRIDTLFPHNPSLPKKRVSLLKKEVFS